MKISKLLVLGAMLLVGKNAWAAVDANVWQKPAFPFFPEVTEFATYKTTATLPGAVDGEELYLYNVGAHMFWTSGNNWATRASLTSADGQNNGAATSEGMKGSAIYFVPTDAATALGADVVEIKNFMHRDKKFISAFGGNAFDDIWTDNDGRDDRFWKIVDQGNGTYRLQNVLKQKELFVGWTEAYADTRLYFLAADAEGACIDWKLVSPAAYEAWYASLPENAFDEIVAWRARASIYKAAMDLKKAIDEAEELGVDVADQITVYNNTASTQEELNAAIAAANEKIEARKEAIEKEKQEAAYDQATAENPAVVTDLFITNPSYANNKNDGWEGIAPGFQSYTDAEFYQKVFDTHQTLKGLKEGVYVLGLQAFYRPGFAQDGYKRYVDNDPQVKDVKLYATFGEESFEKSITTPYPEAGAKVGTGSESEVTTTTEEKVFIPNDMNAAEAYFVKADRYHNKLYFAAPEGDVTIGMKNSSSVGGNWVLYDNWSLTYYGKGADAYQAWLDDAASAYTEATVPDTVVYTEAYLPAYNELVAAEKKASTKEEVVAQLKALSDAKDALDKNISLWKDFVAMQAKAKTYSQKTSYDEDLTGLVADWVEFDSEDIFAKHNLTNEELEAELARAQGLIDEMIRRPRAGADMTDLVKNPNFEEGEKGWTGWKTVASQKWNDAQNLNMPVTGGSSTNTCAEAFSSPDFDLYQQVEGAPAGVYEISVQGFYRYGRGDNAWNWYLAQEDRYVKAGGSPVFVYLNAKKTPFQNVFGQDGQVTNGQPEEFYGSASGNCYVVTNDDGTKTYFPDGMESAAVAFADGMYVQKAYGVIAKDGDELRIGVKGNSTQTSDHDSWVIFDNFKLTFRGYDKEHVKPVLEDAIATAEENLKDVMGKNAYTAEEEALAVAKAGLEATSDKEMFAALSQIIDANGLADDSKVKFQELLEAKDALAKNYSVNTVASDATLEEARLLNSRIDDGMQNKDFSDEDVPGLLQEIEDMLEKLAIPDYSKATDADPVDCTSMIKNANYATNSKDGWSGTEAAVSNHEAEMFDKTFDYYQDIENLAAGTYQLSIQGFYRAGDATPAYKDWLENPDANKNVFLYATTTDGTSSAPLILLTAEAVTLGAGEAVPGGWVSVKADSTFQENDTIITHTVLPNNMTEAETVFLKEDNNYNYTGCKVNVKVGEDGKLRIGVKKEVGITHDWALWTNWQLWYHGTNSALVVDGDPSGVNEITGGEVVKTEFFGVNGAQTSQPGKGVAIMKQTLSDGTIKIQKLIIK